MTLEEMTPEEIRIAERADRMIARLPRLLQAGTNIRTILKTLGADFDIMEQATRRLLESRWYMLARGFEADAELDVKALSDLGAIGALFNLRPARGESADYFRRHLTELAQLHLSGLSRAKSLLHLVSFAYLAEQPPKIEVGEAHAIGRFQVPDGVDKEGKTQFRNLEVELVDNPLSSTSASFLEVGANQQMAMVNGGLEQAYPSIEIKASQGPIQWPILHHEESGFDLIFLGRLEKDQTLSIRDGEEPLVDGSFTTGRLLVSNPTRFAGSILDPRVFHFNSPDARFSICKVTNRSLPLHLGENRWVYRTLSRSELNAYIGHDENLVQYVEQTREEAGSPAADIVFQWLEVTPAAFELRIPADYVPPHYRTKNGDVVVLDYVSFFRDIRAALEYGRAAGVRATVAFSLDLQPEVVTMSENFAMTVDLALSENEPMVDHPPSFIGSVELVDSFQEPTEHLDFGGIFNRTRFDSSWIQSAEESLMDGFYDQATFGLAKFR
ncbi:MAG TPA: hypothetical protein PK156_19905 [Polyangium sp.]|nr:hypothetical protein [Polyangium sp.]